MKELDRSSRVAKLNDIFKGLIGKSVTRIAGGGAAGSIIGVYFSAVGGTTEGAADEWYIAVECSWRVDTGDGPLTSSLDGNDEEGFMIQGLTPLLGAVVSEVVVSEPALDFIILFSQGKRLSVFCDVVRDGVCWYLLGPDKLEVSVEPAGVLLIE